jgi:hypothetical protein
VAAKAHAECQKDEKYLLHIVAKILFPCLPAKTFNTNFEFIIYNNFAACAIYRIFVKI